MARHEPSPDRRTAGARPAAADRRARANLRDLCDEVLASHRVANARDVISDADRREAATLLATITPFGAR